MAVGDPKFYALNYETFTKEWESYTTVKAIICTSSYTPDLATHQYIDDLTNECADVDYARQDVTSRTISYSSGKLIYNCGNISFGASTTITGKWLIIAGSTGSDATSPLLFYVDMDDTSSGSSVSSSSSPFTVSWGATPGILENTKP